MTPSRVVSPDGSASQFMIRQPSMMRRPGVLTRRKSRPFFSRCCCDKRRPGPAMPVRFLDGGEAFASLTAAAGQRGLAAPAGVAGEEAVLAFAADLRRLILAFHKVSG